MLSLFGLITAAAIDHEDLQVAESAQFGGILGGIASGIGQALSGFGQQGYGGIQPGYGGIQGGYGQQGFGQPGHLNFRR